MVGTTKRHSGAEASALPFPLRIGFRRWKPKMGFLATPTQLACLVLFGHSGFDGQSVEHVQQRLHRVHAAERVAVLRHGAADLVFTSPRNAIGLKVGLGDVNMEVRLAIDFEPAEGDDTVFELLTLCSLGSGLESLSADQISLLVLAQVFLPPRQVGRPACVPKLERACR